ncbi:MAG: transposase [Oligoflexia bacterium]|nr:transposase [Oligoflexia bacterium]
MGCNVQLAAIDSTGFESRHVSQHFARRKGEEKTQYFTRFHPKLTLLVDCSTHLILGFAAGRGPSPDQSSILPTFKNSIPGINIDTLLADAGFDGEKHHCHLCSTHCRRALIPPLIGRPSRSAPRGLYRRKIYFYFKRYGSTVYGQRWAVETVFSMLKRNTGSALSARSCHARTRELYLRSIVHNLAVVLVKCLFYRAAPAHF